MTRDSRRHIQLFDLDSPGAATLLRQLHEQVLSVCFPPNEYVPPTSAGEFVAQDLALIACGDDGQVLGGALGEVFSAASLLAYLAVRPGLRDGGVGSTLLTAIRDRWLGRSPVTFIEIDDPRHHKPDPNLGDPEARLRFYGGFGVRLLTIPYFQPRLRPDLPRGYHMFLGVVPAGACPPSIPSSEVTRFLRDYFGECEGDGAFDDQEVGQLLDAVGTRAEIPLVGTDEYEKLPDSLPSRAPLHGR